MQTKISNMYLHSCGICYHSPHLYSKVVLHTRMFFTQAEILFDELTITYLSATSTPRNTTKITNLLIYEVWMSGSQKLHYSHNWDSNREVLKIGKWGMREVTNQSIWETIIQSATDKEPWRVMQKSTENSLGLQAETWDGPGCSAAGKMSWIQSTGSWGYAGIFWSVWVCHNHVTALEINGQYLTLLSRLHTSISFNQLCQNHFKKDIQGNIVPSWKYNRIAYPLLLQVNFKVHTHKLAW